jgi:hypothetical protein
VLERDDAGLGKLVQLRVNAKGRKVTYTLDYGYDRPRRIWWDFVEGNGVKDVDGEYTFEDLGRGRTRATYRLGVDPGLPIPGAIARRIHKQTLIRSVEDLKSEIERRGAGDGAAPPHEAVPLEEAEPAERGYGPLGALEAPLDMARGAAEQALEVVGSVAGSVAGRLGGAIGRLRGGRVDDWDRD